MRETEEIFTARDIGYCLVGLSNLRGSDATGPSLEVLSILSELTFKVSQTEYANQPNLLFLKFGKSIRVKVGGEMSLQQTQDMVYK